ncbi:MAG: family protein phosphatase, partial [Actinomycetota bacterium]|nr:family protein phosphatase [Actinomycetota bacterium]
VAIFRGVQQNLGPIHLSSVYQTTAIDVSKLDAFTQKTVQASLSAVDLAQAEDIVDRLADAAKQ